MSATIIPTPGSPDAREQSCNCPWHDKANGAGFMGGAKDSDGNTVFVINGDCPLHGAEIFQKGK